MFRKYSLVGGANDGAEIELPAGISAGTEVEIQTTGDSVRREVYVAGEDGRLQFDHCESAGRGALPDHELAEALRPVIAKLGAALMEFETVCRQRGAAPCPVQINRWALRPPRC